MTKMLDFYNTVEVKLLNLVLLISLVMMVPKYQSELITQSTPYCPECEGLWAFCEIQIGMPDVITDGTLLECYGLPRDRGQFTCTTGGYWTERDACTVIEEHFENGGQLTPLDGKEMPLKYAVIVNKTQELVDTTTLRPSTTTRRVKVYEEVVSTTTKRPLDNFFNRNSKVDNSLHANTMTTVNSSPQLPYEETFYDQNNPILSQFTSPLTGRMALVILLVLSILTLLGTCAIILLCCRHYRRRKSSSYHINQGLGNYSSNDQYYKAFDENKHLRNGGFVYHQPNQSEYNSSTLNTGSDKLTFISPPPVPRAYEKPSSVVSQQTETMTRRSLNPTFTYMTVPLNDYDFYAQDINSVPIAISTSQMKQTITNTSGPSNNPMGQRITGNTNNGKSVRF